MGVSYIRFQICAHKRTCVTQHFFSTIADSSVHAALDLKNISGPEKNLCLFYLSRTTPVAAPQLANWKRSRAAIPVTAQMWVCTADELLSSASETARQLCDCPSGGSKHLRLHSSAAPTRDGLRMCNRGENMRSFCILLNTSCYPSGGFTDRLK